MKNPENPNIYQEHNIPEKNKLSSNISSITTKEPIELKRNFNMLNIQNYDMASFKSPTKIDKNTHLSK
jgi:hypothetical protein